ncbi:hypothetical protein ARTHROSP310_02540 [Arthrobacter sp. AD-310]
MAWEPPGKPLDDGQQCPDLGFVEHSHSVDLSGGDVKGPLRLPTRAPEQPLCLPRGVACPATRMRMKSYRPEPLYGSCAEVLKSLLSYSGWAPGASGKGECITADHNRMTIDHYVESPS